MRYNFLCVVGPTSKIMDRHSVSGRSGCMYNELVLDGTAYTQLLPSAVEAIFFPINSPEPVQNREGDEQSARDVHAAFRRHYGKRQAMPPLLSFDMAEAHAGRAPF